MSYERKNGTYLGLIGASLGIIVGLIFLGQEQNWEAVVYAEVLSSFFIALSIIILVIDKVLFDKPHFTMFSVGDSSFSNVDAHTDNIIFLFQNDGFRDASVFVMFYIVSKKFKRQKRVTALMRLVTETTPAENKGLHVKVGDQFEAVIPKTAFSYSLEGTEHKEGVLRVKLFNAFSQDYSFFRFKWNDSELVLIPVARIKYLLYEGIYTIMNTLGNKKLEAYYFSRYFRD